MWWAGEVVYLDNVSSLMLGGPSNSHRHGHLPKILLGKVFGSCQVFSGEKKPLRIALGPWGTFASFLGRCSLEELVLLKNNRDKLHQEALLWSFTLWHCTCLWWMSYLKNMAWPKADSEMLMVSSKHVFEDSEAKMESPPCVPPVACWENGWRDEKN